MSPMEQAGAPASRNTNICGYGSRLKAGTTSLRRIVHLQHAASDLVFLDRFEQRLEIAFTESVVALALDEFEEDRPDRIGGENLQQHLGVAAFNHAFAVDQDAVTLEPCNILAVLRQA